MRRAHVVEQLAERGDLRLGRGVRAAIGGAGALVVEAPVIGPVAIERDAGRRAVVAVGIDDRHEPHLDAGDGVGDHVVEQALLDADCERVVAVLRRGVEHGGTAVADPIGDEVASAS